MFGAMIMAFVLIVGLPVGFLLSGAIATMVLGQTLWSDAEARAQGNELVDLNR